MTRWHDLEPADETIFTSAPHLYRFPVDLDVPPERVWESLQSDESLAAWGMGVRSLRWLNPRPFGVGTMRQVVLPLGTMTVREKFFIWEEGERYSFYVAEANRPLVRRFAEDYVVEPESGEQATTFTWTVAIEPKPAFALAFKPLAPVLKLAFGKMAADGERYFANT